MGRAWKGYGVDLPEGLLIGRGWEWLWGDVAGGLLMVRGLCLDYEVK